MARRKATNRVPPVASYSRGRAGSAWDSVFLGANRYNPVGEPLQPPKNRSRSVLELDNTRQQAAKLTDLHISQEIEMAINGDDALLLPYQPTPTINPGRPRTLAAGYDERSQALRIKFRDGEYYTYYNVPPSVWYKFQRAQSPGRYINSTLNNFPYSRGLT
jgi:hypothetical protein